MRILTVDLGDGHTGVLEVSPEDARDYIGGASLAARLLYPFLLPTLDPLEASAPLVFLTGPLTGSAGPAVGRFVVCARSPATGLWGESNAGGFLGPELRAAGWDGIWITGRANAPAYLWISANRVEIRPAGHLWGKADTYETQSMIREEAGDRLVRVGAIGLAGEQRLPFAAILCDHGRLAGRTGMGAVMGSKNLKAVAVRGRGAVPLADPRLFGRLRSKANVALASDTVSLALRTAGSASGADIFDYWGMMPKRYFTRGLSPTSPVTSGANMADTILSGVSTCHACVIACGRKVRLEDGVERKGPEYETMAGFGPNLEIGDLAAIVRLGEWCDRYGMDSISVSNTLGLAYYLFQEGRLTDRDTDGLKLAWGDAGVAETLVHQTARRQGLGAFLAEGARALAERFGAPDAAAQVNGLEMPYYDPRGASGMALVFSTSPRGACHNQSDYHMVEIGQVHEELGIKLLSRQAGGEKARNVALHQDWRTIGNALVLCHFANPDPSDIAALLSHATGFDYSLGDLMKLGRRAWTLKRVINSRLGLTPKDERIPGHFLRPLEDGPTAGFVPDYEELTRAYYEERGWDARTGRPWPATLRDLGLADLVAEVWPGGSEALAAK
ncbi:MAG TPA: aldehyde ferredoxin oxidoreductase family protein [Anaerolineales bacterium]|nr:aldehyde ferredoxin oxidoreductase family protein [Anaerolineales bacterium]